MLTLAITLLFTLIGVLAVSTITHCLISARTEYAQLIQESEGMRASYNLQAAAVDLQLRPAWRPASRGVTPMLRSARLRLRHDQMRAAA